MVGARLVGRERELSTLSALLDDVRYGRGRAVVVLGEAGIGKTALVEALVDVATREGHRAGWGRCTAGQAPPYWPWRQLLRQLGGDAGQLEATGGMPRAELFARAIEHLGTITTPAVLVLEDVHWADGGTLGLLRFAVDAVPDLPLLLVITARDDPTESTAEAGELLRALPVAVERLMLGGLHRTAVAELVFDVLGNAPTTDLAARIAVRTGGNPFFVREVARLQASRGAGADLVVPPGVQQVLQRRLARLSQQCCEVLATAAVVGELDTALLARILDRPEPELLRVLDAAVVARLVLAGEHDLRFAHALVREVAYGQQPVATRSELHRRVAEELEKQDAHHAAPHRRKLARIAEHWHRASGEDVRSVAAQRALAAARDARERTGYEQAVRFYRWALESPPEDELVLRIELGETQVLAGAFDAGRANLHEAAVAARQDDRPAELARALLAAGTGVGGFEVDVSDNTQIPLLEEALSGLERAPTPNDALRAAVLARLSLVAAWVRDEDERAGLAERAIELARASDDARTEVAALAAWCDARSGLEHTDERLGKADEMIAAANRCGDPFSLLLARRFRIVALAEGGDFGGFDAEVATYADTADRLMLPLYSWPVPMWRGMRALMNGDLDACRDYLAQVDEAATRAGSANAAMMADTLRLWLSRLTGETEAIAPVVNRAFVVPDLPYFDAASSGFLAFGGEIEEARRRVRRCAAGGLALPRDSEYLSSLWPLSDAAMLLDEHHAAEVAYAALRPYGNRWAIDGIGAACPGLTAHQLGRLATYLGRYDEADEWLGKALTAHRGVCASLLVAETEKALGELTAAAGRAPRAAAPPPQDADRGELRRSGKVWHLRWHGSDATVPDSKGMRDLATLLEAPEREVHVLDLVEAAGGPPANAAGGNTGETLDKAARAAYRKRLSELDGELAEADAFDDIGRASRLREEQQFLAAELSAALGLGGRARTTGDPAERARTAVANRLRTALRAVADAQPELGRHLDRSIQTGRFCAYRPEQPAAWRVVTRGVTSSRGS